MVRRLHVQILFIFLAFGAMILLSYSFMRGIIEEHLDVEAKDSLAHMEVRIVSDFNELETMLDTVSFTIEEMILQGYDADAVASYIKNFSSYISENESVPGFATVFSMAEVFGGMGYNPLWGVPGFVPAPEGYVPENQSWFIAAEAAGGGVAVTEPYMDYSEGTDEMVITFARCIYDENGRKLATVCIDVLLNRVQGVAENFNGAEERNYNVLLDAKLDVIAHPYAPFLGEPLRDIDSGLAGIADELERGINLSGYSLENYKRENSVVYTKRLESGWVICTVASLDEHYAHITSIRWFLIAVGIGLALLLSFLLIRIDRGRVKAEQNDRSKSIFLASMSHEIRTPINAILGMAEIQMQNQTLSPDAKEAINIIYDSGNLLINIINDILDFSKIEMGKLEITPVKYDIPSLLNDTVQLLLMRYESKPIDFKLLLDENTPLYLFGDELRIKQVINNILSNAFKYTDKGKVTLSVSAVQDAETSNVTLVLQVSDTGQGMTEEQVSRLFEDYTRFNMQANRATVGTGLGMSITKRLLDMMNGEITVESEPEKGSVFTVRLPQERIDSDICGTELAEKIELRRYKSVRKTKKALFLPEYMPYGKVLVVDDVESNLFVAKGFLLPYGLHVEMTESGFGAVEKIKSGKEYDVVFMDHMMPNMDGVEAVKIIRDMGYTRPIVALTANVITGQAEMFMANGFDGFLAKPIDSRELNAMLNTMIRDKYPREVVETARRETVSHKLAAAFVRDAEKAVAVLEPIFERLNTVDAADVQSYITSIHGMKSALHNVGETELSADAVRLEKAGRFWDADIISTDTPIFLNALKSVIEKLKLPQEGS